MVAAVPSTPHLADLTRTKLLDAAGEVFAESGFQSATVREICARAGVNIALVNYHFGDKLELYVAVLRHSLGSTHAEARVVETAATPEQALRGFIRAAMQRMLRPGRPGWHYRLMLHEMEQPTPALVRVIDETMKPMYGNVCRLVGAMLGIPADAEKSRLCAHSVIAQMVHYVHARQVTQHLWPELQLTPERVDQLAEHVADFSMAYLSTQGRAPAVAVKKTGSKKNKGSRI